MRLRGAPLAIAMAGACGVAIAALLGLFEPGWGIAASFPLLCGALAAGVARDPDGPEIHVFLAAAMAFTGGFLVTHVAVVMAETERARGRALAEQEAVVEQETERIRDEGAPKWALMGSGVAIGAAALAWRASRRRRG